MSPKVRIVSSLLRTYAWAQVGPACVPRAVHHEEQHQDYPRKNRRARCVSDSYWRSMF
ncbi:hypothetical protein BD309DRAFT_702925 [Dichomitus squalens]|nr:hypothetical protein BD309DRAFT_702925 [Dichomitus squalens]